MCRTCCCSTIRPQQLLFLLLLLLLVLVNSLVRSLVRTFVHSYVRSAHSFISLIRSFAASIRRDVDASTLLLGTVGKANSVDTQLYVTFVARADQSSKAIIRTTTNAEDERQR